MKKITLYSFLAKKEEQLIKHYNNGNEVEKLISNLKKININEIFDFDESIKYKLIDYIDNSKAVALMFFGGEKIDDVVDDTIEDIPEEQDYRKKHIFCFIYNKKTSEVYFNTQGGGQPSGKRVKNIIYKALSNKGIVEEETVINFWNFAPYLSEEFIDTLSKPSQLTLTYHEDSLFDDLDDELRTLKRIYEQRGVEQITIDLKINSFFAKRRLKKYINSDDNTNVIIKGEDTDGFMRHIDKKNSYKKIVIDLLDSKDIDIIKKVLKSLNLD